MVLTIIIASLLLLTASVTIIVLYTVNKQAKSDGITLSDVLSQLINPSYITSSFTNLNFSGLTSPVVISGNITPSNPSTPTTPTTSSPSTPSNPSPSSPSTPSNPSPSSPSTPSSSSSTGPSTLAKPITYETYLDRDAHAYAYQNYANRWGYTLNLTGAYLSLTQTACEQPYMSYTCDTTSSGSNCSYSNIIQYEWHPEVNQCIKTYDGVVSNMVCPSLAILPESLGYPFGFQAPSLVCNTGGYCIPTGDLGIPTCTISSNYCTAKGVSYESDPEGAGNCYTSSTESAFENLLGQTITQQIISNPELAGEEIGMIVGGDGALVLGAYASEALVSNVLCNYIPCNDPPPPNSLAEGTCCDVNQCMWNELYLPPNLYDYTDPNYGWYLNENFPPNLLQAVQVDENEGVLNPMNDLFVQSQDNCLIDFFIPWIYNVTANGTPQQTGPIGFNYVSYSNYIKNNSSGALCDLSQQLPMIFSIDFDYCQNPTCGALPSESMTLFNTMLTNTINNNIMDYWGNAMLLNGEYYRNNNRVLNGLISSSSGCSGITTPTWQTGTNGFVLAMECNSTTTSPQTGQTTYSYVFFYQGSNDTFTTPWTILSCPNTQNFCGVNVAEYYADSSNIATLLNYVVTNSNENQYYVATATLSNWVKAINEEVADSEPTKNMSIAFNPTITTSDANGIFDLTFNFTFTISGVTINPMNVLSDMETTMVNIFNATNTYLQNFPNNTGTDAYFLNVLTTTNQVAVFNNPPVICLGWFTTTVNGSRVSYTSVANVAYTSTWNIYTYANSTETAYFQSSSNQTLFNSIVSTALTGSNPSTNFITGCETWAGDILQDMITDKIAVTKSSVTYSLAYTSTNINMTVIVEYN